MFVQNFEFLRKFFKLNFSTIKIIFRKFLENRVTTHKCDFGQNETALV